MKKIKNTLRNQNNPGMVGRTFNSRSGETEASRWIFVSWCKSGLYSETLSQRK